MSRTVEEIEAARATRREAAKAARDEQRLKDLEALDALELEHGDGRVKDLDLPAFVAGLPTLVVVRTPQATEYKRFRDQQRRAGGKGEESGKSMDLLATTCVAYPDPETYKRVCDAFPGTHDAAGLAAIKLAEAKGAAEGKG